MQQTLNKAKIPKSRWRDWHFRTDEKMAARIIEAAAASQISWSAWLRLAILKSLEATGK